jgi:toxin ParE1/3/4
MKVRFTEAARRELREAVYFLREIDPRLSAAFAVEVERALFALRAFPRSAQETDLPGVRRSYIRRFRYLIFYTIDEAHDELVVLHIRHSSRRWPWEQD